MPSLPFSRSVAAGASDFPLAASAWAYEQLPYPAQVRILVRTTAVGVLAAVLAGSESIQDETPVQSGGTAGVTPSPLNTQAIEFVAGAGDRIALRLRNTTGGALTVDGLIIVDPLGM
jgi:hypothetical protein